MSGFHPGHLVDHGFAPYGYGAVLSALAAGGIVYSVNGFQAPADFSGEARDPRRDVPRAVLAAIGSPCSATCCCSWRSCSRCRMMLGHGWRGVNFDSPFGQLALVLNLQWLSVLLYSDAVVSPGGSAYVGVAVDTRHTYALAANGVLPRFFLAVRRARASRAGRWLLNLAVIVVFLLPFSGWQQIVSVMGDLYLLTYAAVGDLGRVLADPDRPRLRAGSRRMRVLAPLSFVAATEFVYWSGWHDLRVALPLTLARRCRCSWSPGAAGRAPTSSPNSAAAGGSSATCWGCCCCPTVGSFGGRNVLGAPWDTVVVALLGAITYVAAVASGRRGPAAQDAVRPSATA